MHSSFKMCLWYASQQKGANLSDWVITNWVCWQWCCVCVMCALFSWGHSPATMQEVWLPWDLQAGVGLLTAPADLRGAPPNCGPVREHRGPLMRGAPVSIWLEGQEELKCDVPRLSSSWIPSSQNWTKENGGFEATSSGVICYTAIVTRTISFHQNYS